MSEGRDEPRPALRVSVTGARLLAAERLPALRRSVQDILGAIRAATEADARDPLLRMLSPLAEGADRLVAEAALALGYRLEAVLPFAQAEYEKDFAAPVTPGLTAAECLAQFRELLGRADIVLELDGGHGGFEKASYEAVGRLVVRNADVLVALWDGLESKGRGGTAEIVRFALGLGIPVWWLPLGGGEPRWLTTPRHGATSGEAPAGAAAHAALAAHVCALLQPRVPMHAQHHGLMGRLAAPFLHGGEHLHRAIAAGPPARWWDGLYGRFERLASYGAAQRPYPEKVARDDAPWRYWQPGYGSADRLSGAHMKAYRSAYVALFLLAALALVAAVLALAIPEAKLAFTLLELVILVCITALIVTGQREDWHAQAVRGRLAAELARKQGFLGLLADTLPVRPAEGGTDDAVARRFAATLRAAPLPSGTLTPQRLEAVRRDVLNGLVREQEVYHANRAARFRAASASLAWIGEVLFVATLVLVALKVVLLLLHVAHELAVAIGVISAVLPAIAAFSVGVRSYAEFDLLAEQSEAMCRVMLDAETRLKAVRLDEPCASQEMGEVLRVVTERMLQDVRGWGAVSRAKVLEAG